MNHESPQKSKAQKPPERKPSTPAQGQQLRTGFANQMRETLGATDDPRPLNEIIQAKREANPSNFFRDPTIVNGKKSRGDALMRKPAPEKGAQTNPNPETVPQTEIAKDSKGKTGTNHNQPPQEGGPKSSEGLGKAKQENEKVLQKEKGEAEEGGLVNADIKEGQPITIKPKTEPLRMPPTPPMDAKATLPEGEAKAKPAEGGPENEIQPKSKEDGAKKPAPEKPKKGKSKKEKSKDQDAEAAPENAGKEEAAPSSPLAQLQAYALPAPPAEAPKEVGQAEMAEEQAIPENEKQRETSALSAQISAESTEKEANLRRLAQEKAGNASAAITQHMASIRAGSAAQVAQIKARFGTLKTQLSAHATAKKAAAGQLLLQQQQQVEAKTQAKVVQSLQAMTQRRTAFGQYILAQKQVLVTMANAQASRADSELEAAASQALADTQGVAARYPGNDDPKPKQREAARNVGTDAAREIRDKKPGIRQELVQKAVEFGGKYDEYRDRVFQQIDDTRTQLEQALQSTKADTLRELQESHQSTVQRIDSNLRDSLALLKTTEDSQVVAMVAKRDAALKGMAGMKRESPATITIAAKLIADQIASEGRDAAKAMSGTQVYLKGMRAHAAAAKASINRKFQAGVQQVGALAEQSNASTAGAYKAWQAASASLKASAFASGATQLEGAKLNLDQAVTLQAQAGDQMLGGMTQRQDGVFDQVAAQVDLAITDAKQKVDELRAQFGLDIKTAADESIREGKKPLTDQAGTRAETSAERAGESALMGFLRALGDILVGLLVIVVLAVILVAIAAAFSVVMTLTTAMLIIGAVFLAVALISAIIKRAGEVGAGASPWRLLMAIPDAIGITAAIEGFRGKEFFTGKELSPGEAWYRGTTGTVQTIFTVLGVAGLKGGLRPPRVSGIRGFFSRFGETVPGPRAPGIRGAWGRFTGSLGESITSIGRGVKTFVKEAPGRLKNFFKELPENMRNLWDRVSGKAKERLKEEQRRQEEQKRQEEEQKRQEEEQKKQEEEQKKQEEEQKRQEEERKRQEEEQKKQEEERKRKEEEEKKQEEERKRKEEEEQKKQEEERKRKEEEEKKKEEERKRLEEEEKKKEEERKRQEEEQKKKEEEELKRQQEDQKVGLEATTEAEFRTMCKDKLKLKANDINKVIEQLQKRPGGERLARRILDGPYAGMEGFAKVVSNLKQGPKADPDLIQKTHQTLDAADQLIAQGYENIFFERTTDQVGYDADVGADGSIGIINAQGKSVAVQLKYVQNNGGIASNVTKGCNQLVNAPNGFRKVVDVKVKNGTLEEFMTSNRNKGIESIHQSYPDTEIHITFSDGKTFEVK